MTAQLIFQKPKDPKEFLLDFLRTVQKQGTKPLLDETDVSTMFSMFDITHRGVLSKQQAHRAVKTILGPTHWVVKETLADKEKSTEMLSKDQFVQYIMGALHKKCSAS
jgi:hypothetical protein